MAELDQVIRELESGTVDLAQSIERYERGVALAQRCAALLDDTERKITQLVLGPDGRPAEVALEHTGGEAD
jgi:exodeoxyribonuclease VII small subunit